jgi:hypothetical protein
VRELWQKRIVGSFQPHGIGREHLAESDPAEPHRALFEKVPPRFVLKAFELWIHGKNDRGF